MFQLTGIYQKSAASVTLAANYGMKRCFLRDKNESGSRIENQLPLPPTGSRQCMKHSSAISSTFWRTPSTTLLVNGDELKWISIGSESPVGTVFTVSWVQSDTE